jgi:hypothetical protein
VALADHLHLRRGRLHLQAALLHHGIQQIPARSASAPASPHRRPPAPLRAGRQGLPSARRT